MGMAASQARYLGLTARKTNVEYEGQQVNQQRTALANESAGLFRRLMALEVPTAPSQTDYYETQYFYTDPVNGKTTLSTPERNEGTDPVTYRVTATYSTDVMQYNSISNNKILIRKDDDVLNVYIGENSVGPYKLSDAQIMDEYLARDLNGATGSSSLVNQAGDKYYTFVHPSTGATYYINASANTGFDIDSRTMQSVDFFTSLLTSEERQEEITNAQLSTTSTGLYNSIYWTDEDGNSHRFSLTQSQKYNETGYNDAMSQYNYDKEVYEKTIADINAKTKQLQETDRTLEMRLRQLDTEQDALQNEMEALKKVIEKNVENVFKTFSGS